MQANITKWLRWLFLVFVIVIQLILCWYGLNRYGVIQPMPETRIFINGREFTAHQQPIQADVEIGRRVEVMVDMHYQSQLIPPGEFNYQWCFTPTIENNVYCKSSNFRSETNRDYKPDTSKSQRLILTIFHNHFKTQTITILFQPSFFPLYTDWQDPGNHYAATGWMGDATIPGSISFSENWPDNPHSGQTAIKVVYIPQDLGWAGIYWLHPANNWKGSEEGYDLTGAKRLTFWARSDTPDTLIKFLIGGIGYKLNDMGINCDEPSGLYPDSLCPPLEVMITLTPAWTKYSIDLTDQDLSRVVGGFGWTTKQEATFYIDDIMYEFK